MGNGLGTKPATKFKWFIMKNHDLLLLHKLHNSITSQASQTSFANEVQLLSGFNGLRFNGLRFNRLIFG